MGGKVFVKFSDINMDRYRQLFDRVVGKKPPLPDETETERLLREELEDQVAAMPRGQVPSFPFD